MSTTFDVFPNNCTIPTCGEVLRLAERRIKERLRRWDLAFSVSLLAELHAHDESSVSAMEDAAPFRCGEHTYLWIRIGGVRGGTDGYFWLNDDSDREIWEDLYPASRLPEAYVRDCVSVGHHWSFRRSAGQPASINLAYGFVAAAVAELTNGFVFSDDSAWDYSRFPARPDEFYEWYFEPTLAIDHRYGEWAKGCIASLAGELNVVH